MDMTDMRTLEVASFDLVMDKGARDALMAKDTAEIQEDVSRMLRRHQVDATMAQGCVLQHLLGFFMTAKDGTTTSWSVGVQERPREAHRPFAPFLAAVLKCRKRDNKVQYNAMQFGCNSVQLDPTVVAVAEQYLGFYQD